VLESASFVVEKMKGMLSCGPVFKRAILSFLLSMAIAGGIGFAQEKTSSNDQIPEQGLPNPSYRIPVDRLGFLPPGQLYALMRLSFATLDFFDDDHILFTFHRTVLLPRLPDSDDDDEDQMIHAVVLEVKTGKVLTEADWRMRDRARYLWPFGPGKFLLRIRNKLYLVDRNLTLTPYLEFPGKLQAIQIGLGGHLLVAESQENRMNVHSAALDGVPDANPQTDPMNTESFGPGTVLRILRTDIRKQIAVAHTRTIPYIPLSEDGYFFALRGNSNRWLLSFEGLQSKAKIQVAEIESECMPVIHPVSKQNLVAIVCPGGDHDHVGVGLTMDGKRLWQHRWSGRRIWPSFAVSDDGSRFIYETLVMDHEIGALSAADAESVKGQLVEIFDSSTGKLRLSLPASPILDAGQNFAITQNGRRVAVLHWGQIEVFDLPPSETPKN